MAKKKSRLIEYAIQPDELRRDPEKSSVEARSALYPEDRESLIMPVMTSRGDIRKVKVRKESLERYGKVRGKKAIRKTTRVYDQASGTYKRKMISKKKLREEYIYDERYKAHVRYNPRDITQVRTTAGETRTVTYHQKRALYQKTRKGYEKKARSKAISVQKRFVTTDGTISRARTQLVLERRYEYNGQTYSAKGFSRASDGTANVDAAKAQAFRHFMYMVIEEHGLSGTDEFKGKVNMLPGERVTYAEWAEDER